MANYNTQAINLKSYTLGEADKIIVMYSRDFGILRCIAKGIRKPTSKLGGRMEMLVANKLFLAKGKKLDIVCQAETADNFKAIRNDITKLTYAIYCAELIYTFGLENDTNSHKIYDVFFESLKNISLASSDEEILWTVIRFQLKLMQLLGYAVELDACVRCNDDICSSSNVASNSYKTNPNSILKPLSFSAESGGIVCNNCKNEMGSYIDINHDIVKIFKDALNFDFSENPYNKVILSFCFNTLKDFISVRSHKKLKSPELIECLC